MDPKYLQSKHDAGLSYEQYVHSGTPAQAENWRRVYDQARLNEGQKRLLGGFTRRMNVLVLSGIWCGDCSQQGPLLQRIAEGSAERIDLRWLDRDQHDDLQERVTINGGRRVPVVIFCAEDYHLVSWYGDRTLTRYRAIVRRQLGASCPLPGAPVNADELAGTLQDWLNEFERVQLVLRLSPRLRQKHGD